MVELNSFILGDCLDYLPQFPDKYFELAIVDPPFGGGQAMSGAERNGADLVGGSTNTISVTRTGGTWAKKYQAGAIPSDSEITHWDIAPPKEYFDQLFRVSKNQIIFGGNYFDLPPTRCFIVWDKINISESFSMAMCEYVWTSFNDNAKIFRHVPQGNANIQRIHPCEKPVQLYDWILSRYAHKGDKILDSHVGSGSSLIACYKNGYDYIGFEKDKHYYELANKRLEEHKAQFTIFDYGVERI